VRLALRVHPALDDLHALEIGASTGILHGVDEEGRARAPVDGSDLAAHRRRRPVCPLDEIRALAEVLVHVTAEEAHRRAVAARAVHLAPADRLEERVARVLLGPHHGQPAGVAVDEGGTVRDGLGGRRVQGP
jgi:hypothetical protein